MGSGAAVTVPRIAPRTVRRRVFGRDPATYDRVRPRYPDRVFAILEERCGLGPGTSVFEIGPGTGIATRELLRRGAGPMTLVEPDARMARYLGASLGRARRRATIVVVPFEKAPLPEATFDLGVAATSFHWLPERAALRKVARALRPGGWWAAWSNSTGAPPLATPFQRAIQPLYRRLSPRGRLPTRTAALVERRARLRALRSVDRFEEIAFEEIAWSRSLGTADLRTLWGTFSEIATLPVRSRNRFLDDLARIADEQFGGRVELPMRTRMYTARRVGARKRGRDD